MRPRSGGVSRSEFKLGQSWARMGRGSAQPAGAGRGQRVEEPRRPPAAGGVRVLDAGPDVAACGAWTARSPTRRTRRRSSARRARRFATAASTVASACGQETSKSSRSETCEAVSSGPIALPRPRAAAPTVSRTRAFSVTTCLARRRSTGSLRRSTRSMPSGASVTSRSDGHAERPGRVLAERRRSAYRPSDRACRTRVSMTSRTRPARGEVERHGAALAAAAVEQQGVALLAEQRGGLVHDPARDPDELVLRAPGERGQLGPGHGQPVKLGERQRGRALQRGRRRQRGAALQVSVDGDAGPADGQPASRSAQAVPAGYAAQPAAARGERVERHRGRRVGGLAGAQLEQAVITPRRRGAHPLAEGEREHEALVVVGVLADQVDPCPGRARHRRARGRSTRRTSGPPGRRRLGHAHRAPRHYLPAWA